MYPIYIQTAPACRPVAFLRDPAMRLRLSAVFALIPSALLAQPKVEFNRDVRPILSDNCFACHGPDDKARKADLRLDTGGTTPLGRRRSSRASRPRASWSSRITAADKAERMPPAKIGKPLTPAQVETLKAWVAQGAEYQGHWAFTAPKRPPIPAARRAGGRRTPIDRVHPRPAGEGGAARRRRRPTGRR